MKSALWSIGKVEDVPKEVQPLIKEHLRRIEHLVPSWCNKISVKFVTDNESDEDGNIKYAEVVVQHEYRRTTLYVYPPWLDDDEETRHERLRHEMAHLSTAPLFQLACRIVDECFADEAGKLLKGELQKASEAATEDFMQILKRVERE
jgi:hypothetical protein